MTIFNCFQNAVGALGKCGLSYLRLDLKHYSTRNKIINSAWLKIIILASWCIGNVYNFSWICKNANFYKSLSQCDAEANLIFLILIFICYQRLQHILWVSNFATNNCGDTLIGKMEINDQSKKNTLSGNYQYCYTLQFIFLATSMKCNLIVVETFQSWHGSPIDTQTNIAMPCMVKSQT